MIRLGNAGNNRPHFGFADIDLQMKEFVGALHRLSGLYQSDAQVDLDEVVDGDLGFERRDIRW